MGSYCSRGVDVGHCRFGWEEENEVDSDCNASKEQASDKGTVDEPCEGNHEQGDDRSDNQAEYDGCNCDDSSQEPADQGDPSQESDYRGEEEIEAEIC